MGSGRLVGMIVAVILCLPLTGEATHDRWRNHVWTASQPCLDLCPEDLAFVQADLDGNGHHDVVFDPCASPDGTSDALDGVGVPNEDSYDDVVVGPAPPGATGLEAELFSQLDFDGVFCSEDMRWLGSFQEELVYDFGGFCRILYPGAPTCWMDRGIIEVQEGQSYVIRVYNNSDIATVQGRSRFTTHRP